ncbi:MAG: flagellar biosynthetic protein FliR [Thermoleophilaceae bacterium]
MNLNALLHGFGEQQLAGFILVLGRISPLFVLAPLFSSRLMPVRARVIAALAIAVGLSPLALKGRRVPLDPAGLGGLMLKEILVGLAFAFAVSTLFAAVSIAGSFLDTLIGFSYGSLVDPVSGNQNTVISQMYGLVGILVFIAIGGDGWMIEGAARTYSLVPLTSAPALGSLVGGAEHAFASIFVSALELAAPVVIALILTDAGFGVVSRVVPQLNVFAVGFPAKIIVGFLIIGASLPFAGNWIGGQLQSSIRAALQTLRVAELRPPGAGQSGLLMAEKRSPIDSLAARIRISSAAHGLAGGGV